jgi:hypothetical protein
VIWQRVGAHRAPVHGKSGRTARRIRAWRHERRSRATLALPSVIREPEAGWWALQGEIDKPAEPASPMTTVAVVREQEAELDMVVEKLAELAVSDELLVIFGSTSRPQRGHRTVVAGLRGHLPRHHVVTVRVGHHGADIHQEAAQLDRLIDGGSLPVVITESAAVPDVTAKITSYVRADRVLRVFRTATAAGLFQVWRRRPEPIAG